jgi:hypothetical protein
VSLVAVGQATLALCGQLPARQAAHCLFGQPSQIPFTERRRPTSGGAVAPRQRRPAGGELVRLWKTICYAPIGARRGAEQAGTRRAFQRMQAPPTTGRCTGESGATNIRSCRPSTADAHAHRLLDRLRQGRAITANLDSARLIGRRFAGDRRVKPLVNMGQPAVRRMEARFLQR